MGQITAHGPGLELADDAQRRCENVSWPQQLQGRPAGQDRFLEHDALDDREVKCSGNLGRDHVGEVFVTGRYERHRQYPLGELAILTGDGLKDVRPYRREADRRGRTSLPLIVWLSLIRVQQCFVSVLADSGQARPACPRSNFV
jgi:hypothetical protein